MDDYQRHQKIWRILYALTHRWICRKFNLSHEDLHLEGPALIVPNHVCAWDPLLVAMSLRDKQAYYVASEHLFRLGLVTRLLGWLVAPIPRRKASTGTDTVKACLRHLRAGHSVCLFAEGEQCWDGRSQDIFPATGKLVKSSGASLVTFHIEGGYLSVPRWGRGVRRGKTRVGPVRVYSPEELKSMTPAQINEAINRDIREDAWERQEEFHACYRGRKRAEGLERALYLCPGCGRIGTLRTKQDRIFCDCGLSLQFGEDGCFSPREPFGTIAQWEDWQKEQLHKRAFPHGEALFSDGEMELCRVESGHKEIPLGGGQLTLYEDRLVCGEHSFPLPQIRSMATVLTHLLLFTFEDQYYQIRAGKGANLRKYYEIWKER